MVVNAAGIMPLAPVAELDLACWTRCTGPTSRGTFAVTQQAARGLRRGGAMVNFSTW